MAKFGRAAKKEEKKETKARGKDIETGQKIDNGVKMSGREAARWAKRMNGQGR
ncbi:MULTISPECIES: hypothetical protein [Kribbella]|uniref:CsbD family protein n=1 Tax=Kribbella pratensis TaxID=2512112 RepID=A0ABY2F737_9ACTN|nr:MULTISPECIES: hypothetical protein [Kribbella]TDW84115.1 hypothetical protein EV137_6919 [Kribbella pratensis]TDW92647.1 hypothetical protein EV647_4487 [Kribbella sp. VKM Ac-2566]